MEKVIETDKGAEIKIQSCKLEGLLIKKRIWKTKGEERTKRRKLEVGDEVIKINGNSRYDFEARMEF